MSDFLEERLEKELLKVKDTAHCLGETVKAARVYWREELQWEMSLQALAGCSTPNPGAFRDAWGVLVTPVPTWSPSPKANRSSLGLHLAQLL